MTGSHLAVRTGMIPKNILLVEDNPVNQLVTSRFLTKWGHHVTIANDGKEALEKIHCKNFSLILMDINMPVMDGCEATLHIRELSDPHFKTLPIIAFTASPIANTKEKATQMGMTDFLSKPLDPEEMHRKINLYTSAIPMTPQGTKKLNIHFDTYTDGDQNYKLELINLILANIRELQQAVHNAYHLKQFHSYQNTAHKVKSSILLLNDPELTRLFEEVKAIFKSIDSDPGIDKVNYFIKSLAEILRSLEKEAQPLRHS